MKQLLKPTIFFMMATLFVLISCKSPEEPKITYPENEIPVSTTSEEALGEFMEGLKLYDQGNFTKSRAYFEKALALDPNFVSAQMYKSFTSNSASDWAKNRDDLMAMRDNANEGEALMIAMLEASLVDDVAKELELNKALVEKYPTSARAMESLAAYYNGRDEIEKARAHWQKAHELDADYIPAISALGASYLFTSPKDFKKAEQYMQLVVDKLPKSSKAHINLGDCYRAQNDLAKALASYEMAAQLDPQDEVAHAKAGHANTFMGNYEAARQNFRNARAVSEFGTGGYNFEAYTYLYEGDHEKALAFLQESAKSIEGMSIPDSNKNGAKMASASDCAMIAMHYGDADHLEELAAMMKPMSKQISDEVGNETTTKFQNANMYFWDAMASAAKGDYEAAAAKAEMIKTTMESVNSPNKLRQFHRVHAFVNFKQQNYEKALEHMKELDEDDVYNKYWMAKAYKMTGNEEKAMKLLNEVANDNFNSIGNALVLKETKDMLASTE